MISQLIDQGWQFKHGLHNGNTYPVREEAVRIVDLPHDFMIESDVTNQAVAGPAGGYFTEEVAHYNKMVFIPSEWEEETVHLRFDGVMMNATVEVNGGKVALQHNGYVPFAVDITPYIYFGKDNRITVTVNPSMQPCSRWYSGAGIFRSVQLLHGPRIHIVQDGIFGYTKEIEYSEKTGAPEALTEKTAACAQLQTQVEVQNDTASVHLAKVEVYLTEDGSEKILVSRSQKVQIEPLSTQTAYIPVSLPEPRLWSPEEPNLYQLHAKVTDLGVFKTHLVPSENTTMDEACVLFGVKTVQVDVRHGLRINGKTVKLKGGCIHHDNGMLGAVSLYDSEFRKLSKMKEIGFNAIRTTHNMPSAALMEACDRIGMYVMDEPFDAWGIMKQAGDYNLFFEHDWEKDLTSWMKRDRNHPSIVLWSIGNEIPERGGLNHGYTLATRIAEKVRSLDHSRPVTNGICSYWSGLDDELTEAAQKKMMAASAQNADAGQGDLSWEEYSEAFTNGLDVVGYNYMEDKYPQDHELYPDRVILGSENFGREIGFRWPMVASTPYVIGDFTWTAVDYIGEAGIGKTAFVTEDDPRLKIGPFALMSHGSPYPWRLANDADVDINGGLRPQGAYRSVIWGSEKTFLYTYDPMNYGKKELISPWGFTDVQKSWNYADYEGKPIQVVVFSRADEVELYLNDEKIACQRAGERSVENLPKSFLFDLTYHSGLLEAISRKDGKVISEDNLSTTGKAERIHLRIDQDEPSMKADGHSLLYISVELQDGMGRLVYDDDCKLNAEVEGAGRLAAFGSANPVTDENYTAGHYTTFHGKAMAIIRTADRSGLCRLKVRGDRLPEETISFRIQPSV